MLCTGNQTDMETRFPNSSFKQMHTPPYSGANRVESDNQPKHSSKGASFIKHLGHDFSKQLQIPHEFTMIFNGYIPHRFIIESAMTKKCWRVEVEEEGDGTLYIREGWAEFVEAHSIQIGNFLLFQYEEQSIFQVTIYDKNGCQKMVVDAQGGKHNPVEITEFEEQEERESSESEPKKLRTISPRQRKTRRLWPTRKYGYGTYKKKHGAVGREYTRTATVSLTGNNVAFSVKIHRSKIHQFYSLTVPKAVSVAKNLTSKNEVILQDAMGNSWPVKLAHRTDGRSILSHGWKEFFNHNKGAPGDTLKMEFISDDLIQAHFMKASRVKQKSAESMSDNEEATTPIMECELDEVDACIRNVDPTEASTNTRRGKKRHSSELSTSSFSFLWRPATAGTYLHIPKVIIEGQNMMNKDNVLIRDPEGKCWPLEVSKRRDGRVALTKGWVEFWKGHDMKAGDSFHFEFVSEYLIQANITRGKSSESPMESTKPINMFSVSDDDELATQPEMAMFQADETAAALPPVLGFD